MKKLIAILCLLSIILSFASCEKKTPVDPESDTDTKPDTQNEPISYDIFKTKEIVLGNEVSSVDLTTRTGEKITFDNTADFYEIFDKVNLQKQEKGKLYSFSGETKISDKSKSFTNMNMYILDDPTIDYAEFYEYRVKEEGDDSFALMEEFASAKQLEGSKIPYTSRFGRYEYKDDKAFGGTVYDENGNTAYASEEYPFMPHADTELGDMQSHGHFLRTLYDYTAFFTKYQSYETSNGTYDFDQFVTREYTLYENYIVFKYTAPFLAFNIGYGQDVQIAYLQFTNTNCSITQEAYCNVKTGEIELVKVYGTTAWHSPEYLNMEATIDMKIYIHDINASESKSKIDALINYVKANTTVVD